MDMMYIEQFSIMRDIQLILQTAVVLLKSDSTEAFGKNKESGYKYNSPEDEQKEAVNEIPFIYWKENVKSFLSVS